MSPEILSFLQVQDRDVLPATRAARRAGVTNDYVTHLCRAGKVKGVLIGRVWYVDQTSLADFLEQARKEREERQRALAQQLREEYERSKKKTI